MAMFLSTAYGGDADNGMTENGLQFLNIPNTPENQQHPQDSDVNLFRCFRRSTATLTPTKIDLEEEMTDVAGVLRMLSNCAQNLHVFNNLKEPVVLELHPWRRRHAQADSELV